jgi:hypothetical protein
MHLHQLGFKHVGRLYELPLKPCRNEQQKQSSSSTLPHQRSTETYDASWIYEQLDSLAIPQVTSTFDTIPIEAGVLEQDVTKKEEIEWWRNLRDELIFRKFHKDIEKSCSASKPTGIANTATGQRKTGIKTPTTSSTTGAVRKTEAEQQSRRSGNSSFTSTNTGA